MALLIKEPFFLTIEEIGELTDYQLLRLFGDKKKDADKELQSVPRVTKQQFADKLRKQFSGIRQADTDRLWEMQCNVPMPPTNEPD